MSRGEDRELPYPLPTPRDPQIAQAFLDTADPETGTDPLTSPQELAEWLVSRRLLEPDVEVTAADFQRAITFRQGMRAWRTADGKAGRELAATLDWVVSTALLRIRSTRQGEIRFEPAAPGFDGALGRLLAIMLMDPSMGLRGESDGETLPARFHYHGSKDHSRRRPAGRRYRLYCGERVLYRAATRRYKRRRAHRR